MKAIILLIPATSYRTKAFLDAVKENGFRPVIVTNSLNNFLRDVIHVDNFSSNQVPYLLNALSNYQIQGVLAVDEQGLELQVALSSNLGLKNSHSLQGVKASKNKLLTRTVLSEHGFDQPKFISFNHSNFSIKSEISDDFVGLLGDTIGFPCVVKPVGLNGSRGITRIDRPQEIEGAINTAISNQESAGQQRDRPIIFEEYIDGVEIALDLIVNNSQARSVGIFDKPHPLIGPYFEETIYVTPSTLNKELQDQLLELAFRGAQVLGLNFGPVHMEMRINSKGIYIIDVASRTIGGRCSSVIEFESETILESLLIQNLTSSTLPRFELSKTCRGVVMLPIPKSGIISDVKGVEEAKKIAGVTEVDITVSPGDSVCAVPDADRYIGFGFAKGPNQSTVVDSLNKVIDTITFVIK